MITIKAVQSDILCYNFCRVTKMWVNNTAPRKIKILQDQLWNIKIKMCKKIWTYYLVLKMTLFLMSEVSVSAIASSSFGRTGSIMYLDFPMESRPVSTFLIKMNISDIASCK